jgi:PAS domain S-box-containing protein
VNAAACVLLGYDEAEFIGKPIGTAIADEPREEIKTLAMVLQNGSVNSIEKTFRAKNGRDIPVLFSASVMRDPRGDVQGIVFVAQDITARKQDEETLRAYSADLREINEELKNFAYIVSHDLRAPLVNIRGFSEELIHGIREIGPVLGKYLDGFTREERQKFSQVLNKDIPEALGFIGSSVSRMDNLINAILKLSRAGRHKLAPELVSVQELVRTIINSLAHQIGTKSVRVNAQGLPDVIADSTALEQIFGNLLDNAVKYLEPGRAGEIEVTAQRSADEVVFHVRDNGRGMAKEDIPRAFEIFRRVGSQDVPGEGMGLAYVKTLVRRLGGRIWCESEPGMGTTFSFSLPVPAGDPGGAS